MRVLLARILKPIRWSPAVQDEPVNTADDNYEAEARRHGYQVLKLAGDGAFGKVFQVRKSSTMKIFAMKVVPNDDEMMDEKKILSKLDHNLVVRLRGSFQTKSNLFLIFDFFDGGDLHYQIKSQGLFKEEIARFYAAELVVAVAYLHGNGIMHRDIKPENILLDSEGHIGLTDFGLALKFDVKKAFGPISTNYCGTLDFMAPEVILREGYGRSADWWSVGVTLYKMLTGKFPFKGATPRYLQRNILLGKFVLPECLTGEARSLLNGLLTTDPRLRLGEGGIEEIKKHEWFGCIDWKKLEARKIRPPTITGTECTFN